MNVNFNSATLKQIPKVLKKHVDNVGRDTIKIAKAATEHVPDLVVRNKETIIGGVVIATAASLVLKLLSAFKTKVNEEKF